MKKPQATRTRRVPAFTPDILEPERPLTNPERLALYLLKRNRLIASAAAARVPLGLELVTARGAHDYS